ncbi:MAG: SDR family oxidoreductase [Acidiphilium sp.]
MNLGLAGKVVVVTGGAAGIGAAIVRALAEEGAIPVIFDRAAAGDDAYALDLGDPASCVAAVKAAVGRHGGIDGLVNNAGVNDRAGLGGTLEGALAAFRASLDRNLVHYYTMMHLCLPHLRASRGAVVNVASKVALTGQGGTSGYAAAKGGQLGLTREWAAELAAEGIRVNAVLPAEVATPMYEQWLSSLPDPAASRAAITGAIPLGARMTKPEEIAASVVFLLSAQAAHITGQFHVVDGGYVHLDRTLTAR